VSDANEPTDDPPSETKRNRIGVLIVDDHPLFREGLAKVLELQPDMHVVAQAQDGDVAVEFYQAHRPDITLMDLRMPHANGIGAIEAILTDYPEARIIVMAASSDEELVGRAIRAGAVGSISKSSRRSELVDAIRAVQNGRRHVAPSFEEADDTWQDGRSITDREVHILRLVSRGASNKQIAKELAISAETVKADLKSAFVKLGVSDRTHAVAVAVRRGLVEL